MAGPPRKTLSRVLNVGAGKQDIGDVRIDAVLSGSIHAVADAEHLPFKDLTFSAVYSNCVLEHLRNPGAGLDEMSRVLIPGGTLELTTDHAAYWAFHVIVEHSSHYSKGRDRHYALYTPGHIRAHCEAAGFRVLRLGLEYNLSGTWRQVDRLLRFIPFFGIFTAWRIHVVAVKADRGPTGEPVVEGGRATRLSLRLLGLSERIRKGE